MNKLSVLLLCRFFLVRWWIKQVFMPKDFQMKPQSDPPFPFIYLSCYIKFPFFIFIFILSPPPCELCISMRSNNGDLLIFIHIIKGSPLASFMLSFIFPFFSLSYYGRFTSDIVLYSLMEKLHFFFYHSLITITFV